MRSDRARAKLDAEIEANWPEAWEKANKPPHASKKRNKLRGRYEAAVKFEAWRKANPHAYCSNCAHACPYDGSHKGYTLSCDLDSDFHGIALVKSDGVCSWHKLDPTKGTL